MGAVGQINLATVDRLAPTGRESKIAQEASRLLDDLLGQEVEIAAGELPKSFRLEISRDDRTEVIELPASVMQMVRSILVQVGEGRAVNLVRDPAPEITTQAAAELLNVSRPYLVKLLDEGKIPFRKVGVRRRVLLEDVLRYQQQSQAKREAILAALTAEAQELDLGY